MSSMKSKTVDLVVIGAGAGGVHAAVRPSQQGGRVAIIERENLGGVCMNKGCIRLVT
jgi:dihydrolipoamide dehydrogenase